MANCCDGKKPRKIKEWGTDNTETKTNGNIKLFVVLAIVVFIGIIAYTFI